ncbi:fibrinogen alpha chain [Mugil cephalus]|uniref:fibrinogen alpha chain n=1 Tax=Mugil cephalus TaxID=48193 RepID=UPI001FB7CBD2|nr:fibrinogen alpha chain [Mugil cephalus]
MKLKQLSQDGGRLPSWTKTFRKQSCGAKSDVPLCADDDWVSKCPSGCRLQGLISRVESEVERKLRKVCKTAETFEVAAEKSMNATTHIYNSNRRVIVNRYVSELRFVERSEGMAKNFTSLRRRSSSLSQQLKELSGNIQKQIEDLYRMEVDTDMNIRACRGSCQSVLPFGIDHPSYQKLQTEMDHLVKTLERRSKANSAHADIPHVKLHSLDAGLAPSSEYKTIPIVQRELLTQFEDIGQNELALEELLEESADV